MFFMLMFLDFYFIKYIKTLVMSHFLSYSLIKYISADKIFNNHVELISSSTNVHQSMTFCLQKK